MDIDWKQSVRSWVSMKRSRLIIFASLLVGVFLLYGIVNRYHYKKTLQMRFEDVGLLTDVYNDKSSSNQFVTINDLISEIKKRGLKLNNPIPIDPTRPSYEILSNDQVAIHFEAAIVIEETDNVNDQRIRVRSHRDGSVSAENIK